MARRACLLEEVPPSIMAPRAIFRLVSAPPVTSEVCKVNE